jgi:hypothetical protein
MGDSVLKDESNPQKTRLLICVPRPPLTPPNRKTRILRKLRRVLEFSQSIAVAIAANLLLFVFLSLLAVNSGRRKEVHNITVSVSPTKNKQQDESSSSASAPRQKQMRKKAVTEDDPEKILQEALLSRALSAHSLPAVQLSASGEDFSSGAEEFGIGQSFGKGGFGVGVGPGEIGTIFQGKGLGDGSELLLYVDVSGSMRKHSEKIVDLVKSHFPRAKIVRVQGCAIREGEGFVQALESDWSRRRKIFFVCDLLDEVTTSGLGKLRSLLVETNPNRELHIISYQNMPHLSLKFVIDESWGSVSIVRK